MSIILYIHLIYVLSVSPLKNGKKLRSRKTIPGRRTSHGMCNSQK